MNKFVLVQFGKALPTERLKQVEALLQPAPDWLRFNGQSWIVRTNETPEQIFKRIQPVLLSGENVLTLVVDPNGHYGQHKEVVWNWLKKYGRVGD